MEIMSIAIRNQLQSEIISNEHDFCCNSINPSHFSSSNSYAITLRLDDNSESLVRHSKPQQTNINFSNSVTRLLLRFDQI